MDSPPQTSRPAAPPLSPRKITMAATDLAPLVHPTHEAVMHSHRLRNQISISACFSLLHGAFHSTLPSRDVESLESISPFETDLYRCKKRKDPCGFRPSCATWPCFLPSHRQPSFRPVPAAHRRRTQNDPTIPKRRRGRVYLNWEESPTTPSISRASTCASRFSRKRVRSWPPSIFLTGTATSKLPTSRRAPSTPTERSFRSQAS